MVHLQPSSAGSSIGPIAPIPSSSSTTGFAVAAETLRSEMPFIGAVPSIAHRPVGHPTPSPYRARSRALRYYPAYIGLLEAPYDTFLSTWNC